MATEARVGGEEFAPTMRTKNLPPAPYKDMPDSLPLNKVLGPSVILAGLGVGSGEYILWPFITTQVGLDYMYLAVLGVTIQFFLNMEIERYTLATGETCVAGFVRFWKPWGLLFCAFVFVPNMFPGWASSGATIFTFLIGGGNVSVISVIILVALAAALTTSPVVYQMLEKAQFFKVGMTFVFLVVAIFAAIELSAWGEMVKGFSNIGQLPPEDELSRAVLLSGLVFAGAGGCNNLVQSNWIRDKGFGMGVYIPKIVSPVTGEPEAIPATGSMVKQDPENLKRFQEWWKVANVEQFVTFWFICIFSILTFSALAYSTVGSADLAESPSLDFIEAEGNALKEIVGAWFGTFFWIFGCLSLVLVAMGVLDYVARLIADVLKTVYLTESQKWSESRIYFIVVWAMVVLGSTILLSGLDAPVVLLVIAACLNGMVMFIYSILLIQLNRKALPDSIKTTGVRLGIMYFAVVFYGFFAGWFVLTQIQTL